MIQKGVMKPSTSAGSYQAGASVTYMANLISPSGLPWAAAGGAGGPAGRTTARSKATATVIAAGRR